MTLNQSPVCWVWRHPRPQEVAGRCIGRTDVPVDRRKAKRLAHRIRQQARLHGLPQVVHTSPLQRCALVGCILKSWGWRHHVDEALLEMGFGHWDGQAWSEIDRMQVDAWCADFQHHRPGGGESLGEVFERVARWGDRLRAQGLVQSGAQDAAQNSPQAPGLVVGHAGWMLSLQWLGRCAVPPIAASQWPAPPAYGACLVLPLPPSQLNSDQPPQPA